MNTNRGSEWRKWDLHVHTPASIVQHYETNDNLDVWDSYINDLENLPPDIKVLGINDYIFLDGYKKVKDYKDKGRLSNIDLLLPVIELRLAKFCGHKQFKRINYHIIFSNEIDADVIEQQFLNALTANYKLDPDSKQTTWGGVITKDNLINLGKKIKENVPSEKLKDFGTDLEEGFNNLNIEIPCVENALRNASIFFEGKYITAIGKTEWDSLNWDDSSIGEKKNIINGADIVFTASESIESFFAGKKKLKEQGINSFLLDCSDSHRNSWSKDKDRLGNCFTWIKADPTFEGLKQILYEQEERVKIQEEKPDFKEDKEVIDKVKFISPNNVFTNEEIILNPNLNVIIGGKSSGKSILLYSIAKTLLPNINDKLLYKDDNVTEKYNLKSIDEQFDFEITTMAGITQKISDRDNGDNSVIPNVKFIPQNELVKLAEPELNGRGESLNKLVRHLICEDSDSKQLYDDFINNVKQYDNDRDALVDSYFDTLEEIQRLETELKTKSNKEVLETNIKSNLAKVEELNKKAGLTEEQIKQYKDIKDEQQSNQNRKNAFNNDFLQTRNFLQELYEELSKLQVKRNSFIQNVQNVFGDYYKKKLAFIDDSIQQLQSLISEIETIVCEDGKKCFKTDNIFDCELKQINKDKNEIEAKLKPFEQNEVIQKQIRTLNESVLNDRKILDEIVSLTKNISVNKQKVQKLTDDLFQLYKRTHDEYTSIIASLKDRTVELEKDGLEIKGIDQFNFQKFRDNILSFTDKRSGSNLDYEILDDKKTRITKYEYEKIEEQIKEIFADILSGNYVVNTKFTQKEILKKLLDDYFYDYWEITYNNDKLGEMSTGKASFVILMLIIGLSKSKSPILIDQPEDNLDNRSVTENIVSYLRRKKTERQIILVTHNANIVVNADAENVIVANQKGQNDKESSSPFKFDYINGAIEKTFPKNKNEKDLLKSMGIKEHIADVVEGGQDAFKKREAKYGFKKSNYYVQTFRTETRRATSDAMAQPDGLGAAHARGDE